MFVGLAGVLNVASAVYTSSRLEWLIQLMPLEILLGSRSLTLVTGFFLISVALNLAKRKRIAWLITTLLLLISTFSQILQGLNVEETLVTLIILGVLWRFRSDFTVRSDPKSMQRLIFAVSARARPCNR